MEDVIQGDSLEEKLGDIRNAIYAVINPTPSNGLSPMSIDTWINELYEGYAIICKGDKNYKVPYLINADGTATLGEWVEIEKVWVPVASEKSLWKADKPPIKVDSSFYAYPGNEVKATKLDDGSVKLAGYLVRFGDQDNTDLEGEYFTKDTDFGDAVNSDGYFNHRTPVTYKNISVSYTDRLPNKALLKKDDIGIFAEIIIGARNEYEKMIEELGLSGLLGWSSGTAGHLIDREPSPNGKATWIKRWILGLDASLTPQPAEPRNSVTPIKSITESIAPDAGDPAEQIQAEVPETEIDQTIKTQSGEIKMDEEMKLAIQDAVKAAIVEQTPVNEPGKVIPVTKDAKHTASFGKAMGAWIMGDNPAGFPVKSEMTMYPEAMKGAWEGGTDNEGGYAVPDDFFNGIVEQRDLASWVRQAPVQRFVTNRDRILIPTEATAGTKLVVTDEEAGYDENEPVFGQAALTIYKFTKMLKISEELMDGDGVGIEKYLQSTLARAQAKAENYYCTVGTGSSMPQGLVYASTSSSVKMATADTIVSTDVTGARGVLNAGWDIPGEVGAIMAPSVMWYLRGITGNPFQFAAMPQGDGNSLLGEKIYLAPDCDALTVHSGKVITWANFNGYAFAERQGLVVARNPYLYQANGIVGIFAKARFGGVLLQALSTIHMLGHDD